MLVFKKKIISGVWPEDIVIDTDSQRLITALLIQEHGVIQSKSGDQYSLRSAIFHKSGFGNVVLSIRPRGPMTKKGQIITVPEMSVPASAKDTISNLQQEYGVAIDSVISWTGSDTDKRVYYYAGFSTFGEFIKYITKRLNLPQTLKQPALLNTELKKYSGNSPGYVNAIRSLYSQIKWVNI